MEVADASDRTKVLPPVGPGRGAIESIKRFAPSAHHGEKVGLDLTMEGLPAPAIALGLKELLNGQTEREADAPTHAQGVFHAVEAHLGDLVAT